MAGAVTEFDRWLHDPAGTAALIAAAVLVIIALTCLLAGVADAGEGRD